MAVRTESVTRYSCDLCDHDCEEADLIRLYDPLQSGKRAQIDVCQGCHKRPIADLAGRPQVVIGAGR
ncbi:MAG: hypothetical protein ACTHKL_04620 [Streptosporangiaceae bacterium]